MERDSRRQIPKESCKHFDFYFRLQYPWVGLSLQYSSPRRSLLETKEPDRYEELNAQRISLHVSHIRGNLFGRIGVSVFLSLFISSFHSPWFRSVQNGMIHAQSLICHTTNYLNRTSHLPEPSPESFLFTGPGGARICSAALQGLKRKIQDS